MRAEDKPLGPWVKGEARGKNTQKLQYPEAREAGGQKALMRL